MNDVVVCESFSKVGRPGPMQAISALSDRALDAAVAFDQMRFNAARLRAADAIETGRCFLGTHVPAEAFPAVIIAQVLYEQGQVDETEALIAARMVDIRERSTIEAALLLQPFKTANGVRRLR